MDEDNTDEQPKPTTRPRLYEDPRMPPYLRISETEQRPMVCPPLVDQLENDLRRGLAWWNTYGVEIWSWFVFLSSDGKDFYFANVPYNRETTSPMSKFTRAHLRKLKPAKDDGDDDSAKRKSSFQSKDAETADPVYFLLDNKHWLLWLVEQRRYNIIHNQWHYPIVYLSRTRECGLTINPNESILITGLPPRIKSAVPMYVPDSWSDEWDWLPGVLQSLDNNAVLIPSQDGQAPISYMKLFLSVMTQVVFNEHPVSFHNFLVALTYLYFEIPTQKYICFAGLQGSFKSSLMQFIALFFHGRTVASLTIAKLVNETEFNTTTALATIFLVNEAGGGDATNEKNSARLREIETSTYSVVRKKFADDEQSHGKRQIVLGLDRRSGIDETSERRYFAINTSNPNSDYQALLKKFELLLFLNADAPDTMYAARDKFLSELVGLFQIIYVFLKKNNPDLSSGLDVPPYLRSVITSVIQRGTGGPLITWSVGKDYARKRASDKATWVDPNELNDQYMRTLSTMILKMAETGSAIPPTPEAFAALFHRDHSVDVFRMTNNDPESQAHTVCLMKLMWSGMKAQRKEDGPWVSLRDVFEAYEAEVEKLYRTTSVPDSGKLKHLKAVYFMQMVELTKLIKPIASMYGTEPRKNAQCASNRFAITRWLRATPVMVFLIWYNYLYHGGRKIDYDMNLWTAMVNLNPKQIDAKNTAEWVSRIAGNVFQLLAPDMSRTFTGKLSNIVIELADVMKHLNHDEGELVVKIRQQDIICNTPDGKISQRPRYIDVGPGSALVRLLTALQDFGAAGIDDQTALTVLRRCAKKLTDLPETQIFDFCRLISCFPGGLKKVFELFDHEVPVSMCIYQLLEKIIWSKKVVNLSSCTEEEFIDLRTRIVSRSFFLIAAKPSTSPGESQGTDFLDPELSRKRALAWLDGDEDEPSPKRRKTSGSPPPPEDVPMQSVTDFNSLFTAPVEKWEFSPSQPIVELPDDDFQIDLEFDVAADSAQGLPSPVDLPASQPIERVSRPPSPDLEMEHLAEL